MGGRRIGRIKGLLKKLKAVKAWQLFLIFVLLVFLSATFLRIDHIKMTTLRSEVLSADESGNNEALAKSLTDLQNFTFSHIVVNIVEKNGRNYLEFGTGVFYLEQSYLRAASVALEAASELSVDDSNPNGNIYALAASVCRPKAIANGWSWNSQGYIDCFMTELSKYPAESLSDGTVTVVLPSTELYRREFSSPVWAPTLAGFAILFTLIIGVVILTRTVIWLILEIALITLKMT